VNQPAAISGLPRFSFDPLDEQDRALLARRSLAPDERGARQVVKIGRLQRWLVERGYLRLLVDGYYNKATDLAAYEEITAHVESEDQFACVWARYINACRIIAGGEIR
jgi:hypothetical protein